MFTVASVWDTDQPVPWTDVTASSADTNSVQYSNLMVSDDLYFKVVFTCRKNTLHGVSAVMNIVQGASAIINIAHGVSAVMNTVHGDVCCQLEH